LQPDRTHRTEIEGLYSQHGPALLLFALAITGERSLAQDVVHQVCLRLLERNTFQGIADPKAYLFASVRNAAINDSRDRLRHRPLDPESAWFVPPEQDYVAELNLRHALATLPDEQRDITVLHVWGGLTFSQIGVVLGIPLHTAASRYRYALTKLRRTLCAKENTSVSSKS
jgi:RNA polymerase sigma-70 factor (ECF subfamily)